MKPRARLERLREWLRPPRRLRLQRGGTLLIIGVFGLGLATLNTGNNLLYLLVGALLGLIALSGWLSEQSISGIRVERRIPLAVTAGQPARIEYHVRNRKRRLPSVSLELADRELARGAERIRPAAEPAFVPLVAPGEVARAAMQLTLPRRGVYAFSRLVVATAYPFGLFIKERDMALAGTLVVWPRTDRPVRAHRPGGRRSARWQADAPASGAGAVRGEYRALRPYRPGDDPRDVHWRTAARRAEPYVKEYDRDTADAYWIILDLRAAAAPLRDETQEAAVEIAAAIAARAAGLGHRFGFAAGETRIAPSAGAGQLEAILDALARVAFTATGLPPSLAADECVLVTAHDTVEGSFADVLSAPREAP
jgi:uncharacterized protein (DUF58 family)